MGRSKVEKKIKAWRGNGMIYTVDLPQTLLKGVSEDEFPDLFLFMQHYYKDVSGREMVRRTLYPTKTVGHIYSRLVAIYYWQQLSLEEQKKGIPFPFGKGIPIELKKFFSYWEKHILPKLEKEQAKEAIVSARASEAASVVSSETPEADEDLPLSPALQLVMNDFTVSENRFSLLRTAVLDSENPRLIFELNMLMNALVDDLYPDVLALIQKE